MFKKGHKGMGGRKKGTGNKNTGEKKRQGGAKSLDTYYIKRSRFTKVGKEGNYLDPERVDYYINNDLDIRELLDEEPKHGNNGNGKRENP